MARSPLAISKLQDLRLRAVDGTTVIDKYELLVNLLDRELSPGSSNLLAEPELHQRAGELRWYPRVTGEMRPYDSLSPEEQKKAINLVDEKIGLFQDLSQKLKMSKSSNRNYAGKCIDEIIASRSSFKIFLVGSDLVVTDWGVETKDADKDFDPSELSEQGANFNMPDLPSMPKLESYEKPPFYEPYAAAPSASTGYNASNYAVEAPPQTGALTYLSTVLLSLLPPAILLLALFFSKLLPFSVPLPEMDFATENNLRDKLFDLKSKYNENLEACPVGVPRVEHGGNPPVVPPIGPERDREADLYVDDGDYRAYPPDTRGLVDADPSGDQSGLRTNRATPPDGPDDSVLPTPDGMTTDPPVPPQADLDRGPEQPGDLPESKPEDLNETPPPPPNLGKQPSPQETPPQAENQGGGAGTPLNMPAQSGGGNAQDMSWLKGCWNSSTVFTSKRTGEDMDYYYCFDDKGNANIYANVKDQNGQTIDTCRGGAKAELKDGAMVVESQTAAVCTDGKRNFVPSKVTCKPGKTEAECSLGQSGVNREYSTKFTKRE